MIACICLFNFTLYLDAFKKYILQDCLLYTRDHVSSLMRTSRTARYNNDDFDTVFDRWPNGIFTHYGRSVPILHTLLVITKIIATDYGSSYGRTWTGRALWSNQRANQYV